MKARILSLAVVVLLSVVSIYASNPKTKVYSNINGTTKEYTTVDAETMKALSKTTYIYDANGMLQERALYKWNDAKGWTGIQKYVYSYNDNKTATIVYTKWDKDLAAWSGTSQHLIHVYGLDGDLLAVENIEVSEHLVAAK